MRIKIDSVQRWKIEAQAKKLITQRGSTRIDLANCWEGGDRDDGRGVEDIAAER